MFRCFLFYSNMPILKWGYFINLYLFICVYLYMLCIHFEYLFQGWLWHMSRPYRYNFFMRNKRYLIDFFSSSTQVQSTGNCNSAQKQLKNCHDPKHQIKKSWNSAWLYPTSWFVQLGIVLKRIFRGDQWKIPGSWK